MRPEIAICLLVDATRCLADDILYSNESNCRPFQAHRLTEARSECQVRDSADILVDDRRVGRGNADVDQTRELDSGRAKAGLALRIEQVRLWAQQ